MIPIKKSLTLVFLVFLLPYCAYSQSISNHRNTSVRVSEDTITIDSLSLVPGTFTLKYDQNIIPDSLYNIKYWKSELILQDKLVENYESLTATYRVFPEKFSKSYFEKRFADDKKIPDEAFTYEKIQSQTKSKGSSPFNPNDIIQSGSIGRGLTVGNNQDVNLNSTLNLQLSG
ncbi:MAG: hypothetical protein ACQERU_13555, partial [Bacteroidota bacterium]